MRATAFSSSSRVFGLWGGVRGWVESGEENPDPGCPARISDSS